jgi:hypothetical protein
MQGRLLSKETISTVNHINRKEFIMGAYVDHVKRLLEDRGLDIGKKHKLVRNGLFQFPAIRALNDLERKDLKEGLPFLTEDSLDNSSVLCAVLIKSNKKADEEELCYWNNWYQKALARHEIYFVSRDGFEESALQYAQRHENIIPIII